MFFTYRVNKYIVCYNPAKTRPIRLNFCRLVPGGKSFRSTKRQLLDYRVTCGNVHDPTDPLIRSSPPSPTVCGHWKCVQIYVLHRKWAKANESEFEKWMSRIIFLLVKNENGSHRPEYHTRVKVPPCSKFNQIEVWHFELRAQPVTKERQVMNGPTFVNESSKRMRNWLCVWSTPNCTRQTCGTTIKKNLF